MANIIEEFYYGNIEPQELNSELTYKLKKKLSSLADKEEQLTAHLDGEVKETGNVIYCAYASRMWWSDVTDYNNTNSNGYAGVKGSPIQGLRIEATDRDIMYRVHTVGGDWLGEIKNRKGNGADSYAGIYGKNIDGVQIRTNKGKVKYRVHVLGGEWLDWVSCGNKFANPSGNGYAGIYGKPIDMIQIGIE
jgi:hypothetical protein